MEQDNPLDCPICCNTYNSHDRRPFVGSCGHSVCEACSRGLASAEHKCSCPFCRKLSFKDAKPNYLAIELLSHRNNTQQKMTTLNEANEQSSSSCIASNRFGPENAHRTILVNQIFGVVSEKSLINICSKYGPILEVKILMKGRYSHDGSSLTLFENPQSAEKDRYSHGGSSLILFENPQSAEEAITGNHG